MKKSLATLSLLMSMYTANAQQVDSFIVYFNRNEAKIPLHGQLFIDSLIRYSHVLQASKITLLGYADNTGSRQHNDTLSKERADNIMNYMAGKGFTQKNISANGNGAIVYAQGTTNHYSDKDRKVIMVFEYPPSPAAIPISIAEIQITKTDTPKAASEIGSIDIASLKVNETIQLKDIYFAEGTNDMLPVSLPELEKLFEFLDKNPTVIIQIEGHICCLDPKQGTDEKQKHGTRSLNRAKEIYKYLVAKGIDKRRMRCIGLGTTKPAVFLEKTDADREKNRRAEVRIMSK